MARSVDLLYTTEALDRFWPVLRKLSRLSLPATVRSPIERRSNRAVASMRE